MQKEMVRIIDANFNRSREGLRVCEDIARFVLNSPALAKGIKSVRHNISDILKGLPISAKLLTDSRDTERDVGRISRLKSEMRRKGFADIFSANIERVKESVRVLEEFSKVMDSGTSMRLTALRFKIYDIEKKAMTRLHNR